MSVLHHIGGVARRWVSKASFVWYTRSAVLSSSEKLFISLEKKKNGKLKSGCLIFCIKIDFSVPKPLMELHVKLLRKMGKYVSTDRWEKYLAKVRDTCPCMFNDACDCACHSELLCFCMDGNE